MEITRRTAILSAAAYARVIGANDRIEVGLIGCGNLGMRHLRIYQRPMIVENMIRIAATSDIYTGAKGERSSRRSSKARTSITTIAS